MRILYITSYQGPDCVAQRNLRANRGIGGSRKVELISGLLERAGHEVVVLSAGIAAERSGRWYPPFVSTTSGEPGRGARVLYARGWDRRGVGHAVATISCMAHVREEVAAHGRFDVLLPYNIDEYTMTMVAWYRARYGDVPVVLEYEDSIETTGRGASGTRIRFWRAIERWLRPRLRGVIAVKPSLAERIGNANSYVLRGVVSGSLAQRAAHRTPPLSGEPPFTALYSGSLAADKGLHRILDVAPAFKDRVRFVIAGSGPLESELRARAAESAGDVEVLGYVSQEELDRRLTTADLLLNPHDDDSAAGILPFKIVEYLAAGGAVVTTRAGVVSDDVFQFCELTDGATLAEGIERVLANPAIAVARAREGQAWALATYGEERVGEALVALLKKAVG